MTRLGLLAAVLSLCLLNAPARGDDDAETEAAPAEEPPPEASDPHARNREWLLRAPFAIPRADYFYAALEVPPLESARTLAGGTFLVRLRSAHARSRWRWPHHPPGPLPSAFLGLYHEWGSLELRWGALDRLELGARAVVAGWDEHEDHFDLFDEQGRPLVFGEERSISQMRATSRHENLSVFGAHVAGLLLDARDVGWDLSASFSLKVPVGRERDLTHAGTTDLALTLRASLPLAWGALHANLGGVVPLGRQDLFERRARVRLDPFLVWGAGATFTLTDALSLGLQLEGNTSAFQEAGVLREVPVRAAGGVRFFPCDQVILELGAGIGLYWRSSAQWTLSFSLILEL
ncbi:MAG: hypothetical protein AB7N76_05480 [Planctomycetota bacterium]